MQKFKKAFVEGQFGYNNLLWLIKEILKTFSNQKSFFSSKRLERGMFVISATVILLVFVFKNVEKLNYTEAIALASTFLVAAGFNMTKTEKEKLSKSKLEKDEQSE